MTLGPAYGRNYTKAADVKADWEAGKDFEILDLFHEGAYVNKDDCPKGEVLVIRYGKNHTKVTCFKA